MAKKKLLQDNDGQIWPITTADCVYLSDGSKTVKKYIDDALAGKANSSHGHNQLELKNTNTITSTANDTTANWGAQGISFHWYTETGQLIDQPSQHGFILNIGHYSEAHQLWLTQSSGDLRHRGGNASGWNGTWRTLLDTTNFTAHVTPSAIGASASGHTHSYLPLSGGTITGNIEVASDVNAGLFRTKNAPGSQNCFISGGNGDGASWDSHNMVIRSHWGIGFRDYQDICRLVIDTRQGSVSGQGDFYTQGQFITDGGIYSNGTITANGSIIANGETVCNGRTWMSNVTLSGMFIGEHKFSVDGGWDDPWYGASCAIKAHGNIATNGAVRAGYLYTPQGEFNGLPTGNDSFIKISTSHDGNGQGDGLTHLGYNNGDGYHHFFRGTGAMHINMHQGVQISNNFIYLAGVPLTISGNAPNIGGVWIQI